MNRAQIQHIGEVAVGAALQAIGPNRHVAVIVVVHPLGEKGAPVDIATNITSGAPDVAALLEEAVVMVRTEQ
jgi:hypothetical protein